jgi:DNA mismatch repair protein MutS
MGGKLIFLHQVSPGGASKSYGIEAGRLAGLPASVIDRARQVMAQIEQHSKIALGLREGIDQLSLFEDKSRSRVLDSGGEINVFDK